MRTGEEGPGVREDQPDEPDLPSNDPSQRDPLDILGDSRGLQAIYAAIEHAAARFGHGRWRLVSDLIDATIEIVVNVAMDRRRTPPPNWPRYAIAVCRNLVKKGPPRGPLDLRRTLDWPEVEMVAPEPDDTPPPPELDLAKLPMHLLTEAEAKAFNAVLEFGNVARSAEEVAMTRRDLRVRWRRAMEKIRRAKG